MKHTLATAFLGACLTLAGQSAFAGWIDWTSTTTGTMDVGSTTVGVTLTGNPYSFVNGDYYYNNASTGWTAPSGTYAGMAPSDFIQVSAAGSYTLTFDQAVDDLFMSLISVGQPNYAVTYSFNDAFSVESYGSNYWGYGSYAVNGNDFTGYEYNGILRFSGSFTSISFDIGPQEYWHGFNFAAFDPSYVPEPAGFWLLCLGVLGLVLRRSSQRASRHSAA